MGGLCVYWVGDGVGMGWWVELGVGGFVVEDVGGQGGTHHLINVGNSRHKFVASSETESYFKNS